VSWQLVRDSDGEVLDSGGEEYVKAAYGEAIATGAVDASNVFVEDPDGGQWELNGHLRPPQWVEI
jgi:hypothetical protein